MEGLPDLHKDCPGVDKGPLQSSHPDQLKIAKKNPPGKLPEDRLNILSLKYAPAIPQIT